MTTAHRPTYKAAIAREDQANNRLIGRSQQVQSRDVTQNLNLKMREGKQKAGDDRDEMRKKLQDKETAHFKKVGREKKGGPTSNKELLELKAKDEAELAVPNDLDKDDTDSDAGDSSEISGDEGSDDETEELMRELEKIKKERAIEEERKERERAAKEQKDRSEEILQGNPLLHEEAELGAMKRRWDDDVVFKNQSRSEPVKKKRFINDTIRNDFHRKFLSKYIQ